ncbi:ankyrin repeat protein [Plakobranchus ocellatus]|uniref:Ankyrin repeat protein n=1 Tax=Plakobranchus ocellatus TaxID=259542 RepID=A0AAV4DR27_9GAST|nr:ankyrin repeat protein [Plakobranchus ocellatus]
MLVAPSESPLVEYERFSKFEKLLRVTALIIRFVSNLKSKTLAPGILPDDQGNLRQAHKLIVNDLQKRSYSQELADLRSDGMVCKQSSLFTLAPFLDEEGVIRVKGRLGEAKDLTYEEGHPIIIPKDYVAFLLVKSQHEDLKHAGVGTLISSLRSRYWIISVRSLAKRVVKQCVSCRRYDARPMDQVTAPLPQDRVTRAPPFSVTGTDHAGPLYCSDTGDKKLYIVLFTCAVTRALHLELVDSLSVDDFILAFRRFVAMRALPRRATPLTSTELNNFEHVITLSEREELEESLTEKFWQIWKSEYLRNLPPLTLKSKKTNNSLQLDSVVLIRDEKKPRMWWPLGRVVKLYNGIDGKVRAAQLKTEKGLITRSINHICLLEDSSHDPLMENISHQSQQHSPSHAHTSNDSEPPSTDQREEIPSHEVPKQTRPKIGAIVTRVGQNVKPRQILDM